MADIPQRELRNNISKVLRAAEAGETYTVTVDGRPVATLGPYRRDRWVPADEVRRMLATPTDPGLLDDLAEVGVEADLHSDAWSES